jgi:hypothetical protein
MNYEQYLDLTSITYLSCNIKIKIVSKLFTTSNSSHRSHIDNPIIVLGMYHLKCHLPNVFLEKYRHLVFLKLHLNFMCYENFQSLSI